jgi:leucyl-tRNA synthetase
MQEIYNHKFIEKKHQDNWLNSKAFTATENSNKPKYYCLSMFAYPSGKLHMGHVRNYTIGDVLARYHHLNQYNVMQPFGWDAFGLPAENAAIQNKVAPAKWTYQNIDYMRWQLQSLGLAIDWSREFATCSPDYYKWQQWLFIQLYKKGLIYKKNGVVNWDPIDQTVLANEQVIDGKGWRSGATVIKKEVPMYYFKITAFAEDLLSELDNLPGWPEQVKTMQRNWIGKSSGLELTFPFLNNRELDVTVFTTRADTLMGVTFIAVSNEHPLTQLACQLDSNLKQTIASYNSGGVSEAELATQDKKGVFSGLYVKHPITNANIPVWIANYVIASYGTGAVMGVPAHCQRDFEFAKKYHLEIKLVIADNKQLIETADNLTAAIATEVDPLNLLINSGALDSLNYQQACDKIHQILSKDKLSAIKTNYRLRDWGISRQRYWGCPIPIIHCDACGDVLINENALPVILPEEIIPDGSGSPLARHKQFLTTTCPNCNAEARRETDTMDTFVDSSWYYARYTSPTCQSAALDKNANYWLAVDQYIGGIEHAILHLLYARFFHKCLKLLGLVKTKEPFTNLLTQGMVLADTFYKEDQSGKREWFNPTDVTFSLDDKGNLIDARLKKDHSEVKYGGMEKMSKSKNNGVDPQFIIEKYGADTARMFMMFAAPPELSLEWSDNGLEGANRFIKKLWRIVYEHINSMGDISLTTAGNYLTSNLSVEQSKLEVQLNQTIAKVSRDIGERKQFNTAIASIMELLNSYVKVAFISNESKHFRHQFIKNTLLMLYPIIPHVCEELWSIISPTCNINNQCWPSVNQDLLHNATVEIIIQINGKLRGKISVANDTTRDDLERTALDNDNVKKFLGNNPAIKKIIVVANKLVNIVV